MARGEAARTARKNGEQGQAVHRYRLYVQYFVARTSRARARARGPVRYVTAAV